MASFSPDIVEALNVHLLEPLLFGRLLAAAGVRHSAHYVPFYLGERRAWLSSALLPVVMCVSVVGERDGRESASSEPENRIKPTSCTYLHSACHFRLRQATYLSESEPAWTMTRIPAVHPYAVVGFMNMSRINPSGCPILMLDTSIKTSTPQQVAAS